MAPTIGPTHMMLAAVSRMFTETRGGATRVEMASMERRMRPCRRVQYRGTRAFAIGRERDRSGWNRPSGLIAVDCPNIGTGPASSSFSTVFASKPGPCPVIASGSAPWGLRSRPPRTIRVRGLCRPRGMLQPFDGVPRVISVLPAERSHGESRPTLSFGSEAGAFDVHTGV